MREHRAVGLVQNVLAELDREVRGDPQDVGIERGVVKLAQREAIRHDRFAARVPVRQDVGCLQQFAMAEPADRAAALIGLQDPEPKALLMDSSLHNGRDVSASRGQGGWVLRLPRAGRRNAVIDGYGEAEGLRVVSHDIDGPGWLVETRDDPVKVDEWDLAGHGRPQTDVLPVVRIGTAITVRQQSGVGERIVVGPLSPFDERRGRDAEGHARQDGGAEDALRPEERHAPSVEVETALEHATRQWRVTRATALFAEEVKGPKADRSVEGIVRTG
jgi:hypothetical protein